MHERSLVRALLRQVQTVVAEHGDRRVLAVRVQIGEFSGVEPELLASAYDEMVPDTKLNGAVLYLERVPLRAVCDECDKVCEIEQFNFRCGKCGSLRVTVIGGDEMMLESVTIEETEP